MERLKASIIEDGQFIQIVSWANTSSVIEKYDFQKWITEHIVRRIGGGGMVKNPSQHDWSETIIQICSALIKSLDSSKESLRFLDTELKLEKESRMSSIKQLEVEKETVSSLKKQLEIEKKSFQSLTKELEAEKESMRHGKLKRKGTAYEPTTPSKVHKKNP
jgi:hypothetical protein